MCPERLPEPANAGAQAGGRRASLARSGRARDPTKWSRAQQVKLVVRRLWLDKIPDYCASGLISKMVCRNDEIDFLADRIERD